jgi:hypothetical protein
MALDISAVALQHARQRLGPRAERVQRRLGPTYIP